MKSLDVVNKFLEFKTLSIDDSLSDRAMWIADQAHRGQFRRDGNPYVSHPNRVAKSLSRDDEVVVAYLHDVVEDTDVTLDQLRKFGFTEVQIEAIDSVTKRGGESYLDFVLRAKENPIGRRVKIADIKDNSSDLNDPSKKHLREKYQLALWILEL